jgi:hypothetical protein
MRRPTWKRLTAATVAMVMALATPLIAMAQTPPPFCTNLPPANVDNVRSTCPSSGPNIRMEFVLRRTPDSGVARNGSNKDQEKVRLDIVMSTKTKRSAFMLYVDDKFVGSHIIENGKGTSKVTAAFKKRVAAGDVSVIAGLANVVTAETFTAVDSCIVSAAVSCRTGRALGIAACLGTAGFSLFVLGLGTGGLGFGAAGALGAWGGLCAAKVEEEFESCNQSCTCRCECDNPPPPPPPPPPPA